MKTIFLLSFGNGKATGAGGRKRMRRPRRLVQGTVGGLIDLFNLPLNHKSNCAPYVIFFTQSTCNHMGSGNIFFRFGLARGK